MLPIPIIKILCHFSPDSSFKFVSNEINISELLFLLYNVPNKICPYFGGYVLHTIINYPSLIIIIVHLVIGR